MNNLLMNISSETGAQTFSFSYEGVCDNEFLIAFTEFLSGSFAQIMTPHEFKVVLFCSNELLQNMGFYSADRDPSGEEYAAGKGKFLLAGNESEITLTSENCVTPEQLQKISAKLDYYNSLNTEDLKTLYKQKLKDESPDDSKGGGIGFLEIIRKSKNPLTYSVRTEEDKLRLILKTKLRRISNVD
jgi:hypothetical protein